MKSGPDGGQRRRAARHFGRHAETAALVLLLCKGYRIIARGYLAPGGEIDLIAARGATIAFVEVKGRPDLDSARIAITEEKRRRISRAAAHWMRRHRDAVGRNLRGDAIFVARWGWPCHVVGAFALDIE
jgi:putative endonuclease